MEQRLLHISHRKAGNAWAYLSNQSYTFDLEEVNAGKDDVRCETKLGKLNEFWWRELVGPLFKDEAVGTQPLLV